MNNIINISSFEPEGSIGLLLHPNTHTEFKTILGPLYSMSNGMFFLNSSVFKINWLNQPLDNDKFKIIRKNKKRNVPNYWELVKLMLADRLLQDKDLLVKLAKEFPEDIDGTVFNPVLKIKRGILTEVITNDKLYIYGIILSRLVQHIVTLLRSGEIGDYEHLTNAEYKLLVTNIKKYVWDDIIDRVDNNILAAINDDMDNDTLKKEFMSIGTKK